MPAALVTQQAVSAVAIALLAEGTEPSIRKIQARLGVGSYTTVKNYFELWKKEQVNTPPIVAVPDAITARSNEFTSFLWSHAAALAAEQTQQARADATQQVEEARTALAEAEATIARLESDAETQSQELSTSVRTVKHLQNELSVTQAALQAAEARAQEIERRASELRSELDQARAAERQLARLEGETEALKRQIADQQAMIERANKSS